MQKIKYSLSVLFVLFSCINFFAQQSSLDSISQVLGQIKDPIEKAQAIKITSERIVRRANVFLVKEKDPASALLCYQYVITLDSAAMEATDFYNAACAAALTTKTDEAFAYLKLSAEKGWNDVDQMRADADLVSLRAYPEWDTILETIELKTKEGRRNVYWGIYFGILFTLFFYNILLYFSLRESLYLHYVIYLFLYASVELMRTSELNVYLPSVLNWMSLLNPRSGMMTFCVAMIGTIYLLFSSRLLELKSTFPSANVWMKRLMFFTLIVCFVTFFFRFSGTIITLLMVLAAFFVPLTLSVRIYNRGYKPARFFVIGNLFYLIGMLWTILPITGLVHSTRFFTVFRPDNVGSVLFFSMLSMALGDKINLLKKDKIEAQEKAMELLEEKVEERTKEVVKQKHLVEEKHKEITDSINYAERIQRSFLATDKLLDENLKEYFVLFQPKDVVSGDFYWAGKLSNGNFALATADSTGHGVPGAIMSILNISCLEKAMEAEKLNGPAEILNHTRVNIIERLKKDGSAEGGKDGMDCSLVSFDFKNNSLVYAAANNPVWIVRGGVLIELDADSMPVGKHDRDSISFTQNQVELQKGDMIYTLTDGFPDQFGGPKGKKFMYKKLKELFISISLASVTEQKKILLNTLQEWKGELEQVDDICIIGVRV